jgi:hypothetical protein
MTSSVEHRRMERFSLELPARLQRVDEASTTPGRYDSYSIDISACGGFFVTDSHLPIGTEVAIDLFIPLDALKKTGGKTHVHVSGFVVRTAVNGVAVSFDEQYQIFPSPPSEN